MLSAQLSISVPTYGSTVGGSRQRGVAEPMYSTSGKATTTNTAANPPIRRALRTILGCVRGTAKSRADGAPSGLLSHRLSRVGYGSEHLARPDS